MKTVQSLSNWLDRYFRWLLFAVYGLAPLLPAPGLRLRDLELGEVQLFGNPCGLAYDLAGAVEKLPNLLPTEPNGTSEPNRLAATGTEGKGLGCSLVAQIAGNEGHFEAFQGNGVDDSEAD